MEKQFIYSWFDPAYQSACLSVSFSFFVDDIGYYADEIKKVENLKVWEGCQLREDHYVLRIQ